MRGAIFSLMQRSSVRYDVSRAPRRAFLKAQPATAARDDEKCTHDRMRRVCISVQWTCSRGKPDFPVAPIHVLWFPRDACTPGCPLLYYQTAGYRFTSESSNYLSAAIETRYIYVLEHRLVGSRRNAPIALNKLDTVILQQR